ncbi:InlB B-repeat-containing protein [Thermomonas flagellata]|uniref:InlB B-repeat-containing protein n=1 Tax=Thermomonas flagellata TaxID=2888524 RepID=UPI001F044BE6|nr:InlB B-repeat-containing protein [Thermomonas flagellata]
MRTSLVGALLLLLSACGGGGGGSGGSTPPAPPPPTPTRHALNVTLSGSGKVTSSPAGIDCGSTCSASFDNGTAVTLTASPASGQTFTGWSGDCSGSASPCTVAMTQARSVGAAFAPVRYTLSVSLSGSGKVTSSPAGIDCGSTCSASFDNGTAVTLTATPASGQTFTGWSGDCSGSATACTVAMGQARSVGASFAGSAPFVVERVFAPSSFWYAPIPANATLDPKSSVYAQKLVQQIKAYYNNVNLNTYQYAAPIYVVQTAGSPVNPGNPAGTTPVMLTGTRINVTAWDCQNRGWVDAGLVDQFKDVPVPTGARAADGTDQEMAIYDLSTQTYWEFWIMRAEGGGWKACWGGRLQNVAQSDGRFPFPYGATATGLPFIGGEITAEELARGEIRHVMGISLVDVASWDDFSWPATRSDGWNPNNEPDRIREGTRFRLDPSINVEALPMSRAGKIIARAAQIYGFVVWDKAGSVSLRVKNPYTYIVAGQPDPYPALFEQKASWQVLDGFPWDRTQFMPKDYGKP